jgi:transposase
MQSPTESLFSAALHLDPPWYCAHVEFDKQNSRLDVAIDFHVGGRFPCPKCQRTGMAVHDTVEKEWRHMDFFEHQCFLHARVPRIRCDACGVVLANVPWARPGSGFTLLYEALVLALVPQMSVKGVARHMRIHDTRIWRIVHHYVDEARAKVEYHDVRSLAIDETSARRGHRYVAIAADPEKRRVVYVTEGKGKATVGRLAQDFHEHNGNPDAIREMCMDMSPAFIEGVRECFPNAAITFDHFHVMQMASKAMDALRREETRTDAELKGSRYTWLLRRENLSDTKEAQLQGHLARNERMARGYHLVLDLRGFYELEHESPKIYLMWWYYRAMRSGLEPFRELAESVRRHMKGIVNYFKSKMANGFMEGLNGMIQTAKRVARGYRSVKNFIAIIYMIAGKLPLNVPT